jgi:hypothetical protein
VSVKAAVLVFSNSVSLHTASVFVFVFVFFLPSHFFVLFRPSTFQNPLLITCPPHSPCTNLQNPPRTHPLEQLQLTLAPRRSPRSSPPHTTNFKITSGIPERISRALSSLCSRAGRSVRVHQSHNPISPLFPSFATSQKRPDQPRPGAILESGNRIWIWIVR